MQDLIGIGAIVALVVAVYFGPPLMVMFTQSPSDVARIKVIYEGIDGPVGPYTKVVDVRRKGTIFSARPGSPSARTYEVRLEKIGGGAMTKIVQVDATLLGDGRVSDCR